jgi:hypothetical protein
MHPEPADCSNACSRTPLRERGSWGRLGQSAMGVLADHDATFRLAPVIVLTPPAREGWVGGDESVEPSHRLNFRNDEAITVPRTFDQALRADAIDRPKVDRLGLAPLFIGYVFRRLAGHLRRGNAVKIEAVLSVARICYFRVARTCHSRVARSC